MIPTTLTTKLVAEMGENLKDLVFERNKAGVLRQVVIPATMLEEKVFYSAYNLDRDAKKLTLVEGKSLVALTDVVGISGKANIDVLFIDDNTMLVQLNSGSVYYRNKNGIQYGFKEDGNLTKNFQTAKVRWLTVKDMQDYAAVRLKSLFNVEGYPAQPYIYNGIYNFELEQLVASQETVLASTRVKVVKIYDTPALGEFEFVVAPDEPKMCSFERQLELSRKYSPLGNKSSDDVASKIPKPVAEEDKVPTEAELLGTAETYEDDEMLEEDYDSEYYDENDYGYDNPDVDNSSDEESGMFVDGVYKI